MSGGGKWGWVEGFLECGKSMISIMCITREFCVLSLQQRIKKLLSGMAAAGEGRLTASAIGSIVGLQSEHIQQMASQYAEKVRIKANNLNFWPFLH